MHGRACQGLLASSHRHQSITPTAALTCRMHRTPPQPQIPRNKGNSNTQHTQQPQTISMRDSMHAHMQLKTKPQYHCNDTMSTNIQHITTTPTHILLCNSRSRLQRLRLRGEMWLLQPTQRQAQAKLWIAVQLPAAAAAAAACRRWGAAAGLRRVKTKTIRQPHVRRRGLTCRGNPAAGDAQGGAADPILAASPRGCRRSPHAKALRSSSDRRTAASEKKKGGLDNSGGCLPLEDDEDVCLQRRQKRMVEKVGCKRPLLLVVAVEVGRCSGRGIGMRRCVSVGWREGRVGLLAGVAACVFLDSRFRAWRSCKKVIVLCIFEGSGLIQGLKGCFLDRNMWPLGLTNAGTELEGAGGELSSEKRNGPFVAQYSPLYCPKFKI